MFTRSIPLLAVLLLACSGTASSTLDTASGGGTGSTSAGAGGQSTFDGSSTSDGPAVGVTTATSSSSGSGGMSTQLGCFDEPPADAPPLSALVDATGCPDVKAGANTVDNRTFFLAVPSDLQPDEKLPVVFLWHWLGGSGQGFLNKAEVQTAVDHYRFIGVAMEAKGDLPFKWPFLSASTPVVGNSEKRVQEDLSFFDRTLACVNHSFNINRQCISSVGVSAGALFTQVLAGKRSEVLSSFESLSGGEGDPVRSWNEGPRALPAMVLWGGPTDSCAGIFSFDQLSKSLANKLAKNEHFLLECIHNCGHSVPPFEPLPSSPTTFGVMWEFVLDHPRWLKAGDSPWLKKGFPEGFPSWCSMGVGKATPRVGACKEKSSC